MFGAKWRTVLLKAWSIRWTVAAFIFTGLEIGVPLMDGFESIPRGAFAALAGASSAGAFLSRLMVQKEVTDG